MSLIPVTGKTGGAILKIRPASRASGASIISTVKKFISETGFNLLEHDGSYPGDVWCSKLHIGHKGLADSVMVAVPADY